MNEVADPNWYEGIGVTAHMTSNADSLSSSVPYSRKDKTHICDGASRFPIWEPYLTFIIIPN